MARHGEKDEVPGRGPVMEKLSSACTVARVLLILYMVYLVLVGALVVAGSLGALDMVDGGLPAVVHLVAAFALFLVAALAGERTFRRISYTGRPFSTENVRDLRLVSVAVLTSAVVPGLLDAAVAAATQVGPAASVVDVPALFVGCLLLAVTKVFEYGCVLQRQDDELL